MRLRVVVLAGLLAGCASEVEPAATTTSVASAPSTVVATTQALATTAVAKAPERCETAGPALVTAISEGLKGATALRFASAVKSNDYSKIYMVAADLEGPALEGKTDQAVWATNDLEGKGLIYSADGMAEQFSTWGPGDKTAAKISSTSDGVKQAKECSASLAKG